MRTARLRLLIILAGVVVVSACLLFRALLPGYAVSRLASACRDRLGASLTVESARCSGFAGLLFDTLVVRRGLDTVVRIDRMAIQLSLSGLVSGKGPVKAIEAGPAFIRTSVLRGHRQDTVGVRSVAGTGTGTLLSRAWSRTANALPASVRAGPCTLLLDRGPYRQAVVLDSLALANGRWHAVCFWPDSVDRHRLAVAGVLDPGTGRITATFVLASAGGQGLALYPDSAPPRLAFDTARIGIQVRPGRERFTADIHIDLSDPSFTHWRLSAAPVTLHRIAWQGRFGADDDGMGFDTASTFRVDSLEGRWSLAFRDRDGGVLDGSVETQRTDAGVFFRSLPAGMFDLVRDIRAEGTLAYRLSFHFPFAQPDSLAFDSELRKDNFRIRRFGAADFTRINEPFTHTAFEDGMPVRTIDLDASNPGFTPLDRISPFLVHAVLTSEDGSFFRHAGFNEEAFRASIAENIRQRRFARGGSTVTMQLVKNVFLESRKTVARKAQEALITWLIESNRLVPKERLLEVYLNIIEWGPGVYGIAEASHFYFDKSPDALTLAESIFLASLVPHPRYYRYSVDAAGCMRPFLVPFFKVVAGYMLRREQISQDEYDRLVPDIELTGPARDLVRNRLAQVPDSVETMIREDLEAPME